MINKEKLLLLHTFIYVTYITANYQLNLNLLNVQTYLLILVKKPEKLKQRFKNFLI